MTRFQRWMMQCIFRKLPYHKAFDLMIEFLWLEHSHRYYEDNPADRLAHFSEMLQRRYDKDTIAIIDKALTLPEDVYFTYRSSW